jgi:hypothetical protein
MEIDGIESDYVSESFGEFFDRYHSLRLKNQVDLSFKNTTLRPGNHNTGETKTQSASEKRGAEGETVSQHRSTVVLLRFGIELEGRRLRRPRY